MQGAIRTKDDIARSADRAVAVVEQIPAKIDELAKKLGATVIGRIDELNTYRLKFASAEEAEAARKAGLAGA